jgi:general secretion pathway protein A
MYEAFFGLEEPAFSLTPDPRFLWPSETHQEGLSTLIYGITRRKGFILLTGEVGAGKTTLLRAALDELRQDLPDPQATAMVMHTGQLSGLDLLKLISVEFGIRRSRADGPPPTAADYTIELTEFLVERWRGGRTAVLIIDEAQNLGLEALEYVRMLSNFESDSEKLLQIVLTGQPELRDKLASWELRQLRQRIALSHHVDPLASHEVGSYLRHRIEVAGGRYAEIFAEGADPVFVAFSGGCPRLINLLADRVLLSAYARQLRPVPLALLEAKAKELGEMQLGRPAAHGGGEA